MKNHGLEMMASFFDPNLSFPRKGAVRWPDLETNCVHLNAANLHPKLQHLQR
jgi:hypothetical protein